MILAGVEGNSNLEAAIRTFKGHPQARRTGDLLVELLASAGRDGIHTAAKDVVLEKFLEHKD